MRWYDIRDLGVEGKGWSETKHFYDRLPLRAEGIVREPVWGISQNSAGLFVRFVSDATSIAVRWTLRSNSLAMPHMAATGVSGVDLYAKDKGQWRWLGVGMPDLFPTNEQVLGENLAGKREYLLYLPLYNGIESVQIGVPSKAALMKAPAYKAEDAKPIIFYGTSITQGACASRPGMAYPALLGRRLDRPVINLGFSGQGKMDPEIAKLLAELDPAMIVIDCLANLEASQVAERTEPFVRILRQSRPTTPIVLVGDVPYPNFELTPETHRKYIASNTALHRVFERLVSAGDEKLYYIPGDSLLGNDGEATVDGVHPTDLGFVRMADIFEPVLRKILKPRREVGGSSRG